MRQASTLFDNSPLTTYAQTVSPIRPLEAIQNLFRKSEQQSTQNSHRAAEHALQEFLVVPDHHVVKVISPNSLYPEFTLIDVFKQEDSRVSSTPRVVRLDGEYAWPDGVVRAGCKWFVAVLVEESPKKVAVHVYPIQTVPDATKLEAYANHVPQLAASKPLVLPFNAPYLIEQAAQAFSGKPPVSAQENTEHVIIMRTGSGRTQKQSSASEPELQPAIPGLAGWVPQR